MWSFLFGIVLLVVGYFTYGKFVELVIAPDDRVTPAIAEADGVDYVVLPKWKNMLIQLLNIAGIGPVIGVIAGIKFGTVVFLIIPLGCIVAGATHDFLGGMMSIRDHGANLPKIIRENLGKKYARFFSWFMIGLLLLVVAVFINVPATLVDKNFLPDIQFFWWAVGIIFVYYVVATLFPVDKIIGAIYPFFAIMLLVGTFALFFVLVFKGWYDPSIFEESTGFKAHMFTSEDAPIFPLLFVTIACGIISGFHATQSPIVARTMKSEKEARATFYGMMIAEGVIAMIWAGAALYIYNKFPAYMKENPNNVLGCITNDLLGSWMGSLTVIAVVILAITSGDTALRSTRLALAEMIGVSQKKFVNRILICLPLIAIVSLLLWWSNSSKESFGFLWNYFAWGNQVLAASTLMAAAVWLKRRGKLSGIALLPGMFMTFTVVTYILWTSPAHKQAYGFGLPICEAYAVGILVAILFAIFAYFQAGVKGRVSDGAPCCTDKK